MKNAMKAMIVFGTLIVLVSSSIAGCGKNKEEKEKAEQNRSGTSSTATEETAEKSKEGSNSGATVKKETITPEKEISTPNIVFANGRFQIAGFAVALSSVHRQENRTDLQFAITKVKNAGLEIEPIAVTLTDDHNNHYRGALEITPYTGFPLHLLPVDFTYVKTASIVMPKPAPIETVQVGDTKHIVFKKLRLVKPQFKSDFGTALLQPGKPTPVGRFLSFTIDGIVPDLYTWSVAATIENKDYNELRSGILCAVQFTDGNIAPPTKPEILVVPGLSKKTTRLRLASLQGIQIPKVRTLLISYHEWRSNQTVLKLWTMSDKDFPPRVGQGTNEDIFIEAYRRNGSRNTMGDPVGLPHWYVGGTTTKDEHDLFIQEFPSVSRFGKSVIIWDKQNHASRAYVLHGPILEKYHELGGPYHSSKDQEGSFLGAPTSDVDSLKSYYEASSQPRSRYRLGRRRPIRLESTQPRLETEGNYSSFKGGIIVSRDQKAVVIAGKIYKKWKEEDLARSSLRFPIGDERFVSSGAQGFNTTGLAQDFGGGHIYYCSSGEQKGQSFVISGAVDDFYSSKMQGSASWLGFPISERYAGPETGYEQCDFEAGFIATSDGKRFQTFPYEPGMIAFVSDRDGNKEIYVTDSSGRKQTNVSKNPADDWAPALSPDGNEILFVSNRQPRGIYVMNTDGSDLRFLAKGTFPCWFPDGSKSAFVREIEFRRDYAFDRIFLMNIDGSAQSPFAFFPGLYQQFVGRKITDVSYPVISPDGQRLMFAMGCYGDPLRYIYTARLDGSELTELGRGYRASWSPDGRWLASRHDSIINIESLNMSILTNLSDIECRSMSTWSGMTGGRTYIGLSWAPDGSAIAFCGRKKDEKANVYTAPIGTKIIRRITKDEGNNYDPSWAAVKQKEKTKTVSKKQFIPGKEITKTDTVRSPVTGHAPQDSSKQELIAALEDLQSAMIKKIYLEVDITAQSFTSVKEYRRAKLLADVLRPVLRVLQGTLSVLSKIADATTLSGQVKTSLDNAQYVSEAASLAFMINGLRESGEKLYYAIDDTAGYVRTVKDMLQAADQTTVIRMDPRAYKQVIKQYLDSEQGTPLIIARTSELAPDKKPAKGALVLYKIIREEFRTLIEQIQRSELPPEFPVNDVVAEIEQLKHQIVEAGVHNVDVHYSIYHQDRRVHQSRKLGAIAEHNKAFAAVAGALAKRQQLEIYAEYVQLAGSAADVAYIVTYNVPGAGEAVKMTQQVTLLPQIVIEGKKMFTVDPEEQFYQMPQEMLFSLAIEFSSLLRIADDTVLSLTELLKETRSQVPPGEVRPAPTSTKQKEPAKKFEKQVEEAVKSLFKKLLRKSK